jgi:hypothetical protein
MGALAHFDFNQAGAHAYEQALMTIRQLGLAMASVEEQFRRMVFNIVARNQDDHVKNIAFLMDKNGTWSLAPAFDLTYSYNPSGAWTASHQMTMNGKRDGFTRADFEACARAALMKRGRGATLAGIRGGGVACRRGPELAPGEPGAERASFGDVVLVGRLRGEIHRLNPAIPAGPRRRPCARSCIWRPRRSSRPTAPSRRCCATGWTWNTRARTDPSKGIQFGWWTSRSRRRTTDWRSTSSRSSRASTTGGRTS